MFNKLFKKKQHEKEINPDKDKRIEQIYSEAIKDSKIIELNSPIKSNIQVKELERTNIQKQEIMTQNSKIPAEVIQQYIAEESKRPFEQYTENILDHLPEEPVEVVIHNSVYFVVLSYVEPSQTIKHSNFLEMEVPDNILTFLHIYNKINTFKDELIVIIKEKSNKDITREEITIEYISKIIGEKVEKTYKKNN